MKLFTSYYAKSAENPKAMAISCRVPTYYHNLKTYPALAPKWEFVLDQIKGTTTWENYVDRYMDLIVNKRKLNAHQLLEVIPDGTIFLCYERPEEMGECHRRLVARWIEEETGLVVPELGWQETSPLSNLIEW